MAAGPVARSRAQIPLRLCFLLFLPSIFDILQKKACSKNFEPLLLHFSALCDLPETSKKFRKKIRKFFSQFLVF